MQKYSLLFIFITSTERREKKNGKHNTRFKVNRVSSHWYESRNLRMQCRVAQSKSWTCSSPPESNQLQIVHREKKARRFQATHIKRILNHFVPALHEISEHVYPALFIYRSIFNQSFKPNGFISRLIIYCIIFHNKSQLTAKVPCKACSRIGCNRSSLAASRRGRGRRQFVN